MGLQRKSASCVRALPWSWGAWNITLACLLVIAVSAAPPALMAKEAKTALASSSAASGQVGSPALSSAASGKVGAPASSSTAPAKAARPEKIEPKVFIDMPENPTVGDDVEFHVQATVESGVRLVVPEALRMPESVLLMREGITLKRKMVDSNRVAYDLTVPLRIVGVGWVRISPQTISFEMPAGNRVQIRTPKVKFHTGTLFPSINDPAPSAPLNPVALVETNWVLIWILIVLGVALGAALLTLLVVRWRRGRYQPPPPPPIPPHEQAMTRLNRLAGSDLIEKGEFARYYTELSETLREYLGGRWRFDSMDLTTTELIHRLKRVTMEGVVLEEVVSMLQDFDLVKFAKVEPAPEMAKAALRQVSDFVERTHERAKPAEKNHTEAAS